MVGLLHVFSGLLSGCPADEHDLGMPLRQNNEQNKKYSTFTIYVAAMQHITL
jgi:hypothetical protein